MTCLFQISSLLISVVLINVTEAVVINSSFNTRTHNRQQLNLFSMLAIKQDLHFIVLLSNKILLCSVD